MESIPVSFFQGASNHRHCIAGQKEAIFRSVKISSIGILSLRRIFTKLPWQTNKAGVAQIQTSYGEWLSAERQNTWYICYLYFFVKGKSETVNDSGFIWIVFLFFLDVVQALMKCWIFSFQISSKAGWPTSATQTSTHLPAHAYRY